MKHVRAHDDFFLELEKVASLAEIEDMVMHLKHTKKRAPEESTVVDHTTTKSSRRDASVLLQEELSFDLVNLSGSMDQSSISQFGGTPGEDSMCLFPVTATEVQVHILPEPRRPENDNRQPLMLEHSCQWTFIDYFDAGGLAGTEPCWNVSNTAATSCPMHDMETTKFPMILFCIQVMDELIFNWKAQKSRHRMSYYIQTVIQAREVFLSQVVHKTRGSEDRKDGGVIVRMHEEDVMIYLDECRRLNHSHPTFPGIASFLWHVIGQYWKSHKHHYAPRHFRNARALEYQDEIPFTAAAAADSRPNTGHPTCFGQRKTTRHCRLVEDSQQSLDPSVLSPMEAFGRHYVHTYGPNEHYMSNIEWTYVFEALMKIIQHRYPAFQVFPTGAFARGAQSGNVMDFIVSYPHSTVTPHSSAMLDSIVKLLREKSVLIPLSRGSPECEVLTDSRYFGVMKFKQKWIIVDLKLYQSPQSWFGLTYFTGPESFANGFFHQLLTSAKEPHVRTEAVQEVQFADLYEQVVDRYGLEALEEQIQTEEDVFRLCNRAYIPPVERTEI